MTVLELLPAAEAVHGNAKWYELRRAGVTASEIAAVMGISPWESPFSIYWQKVNGWHADENAEMSAGRRAEGVIADWYAERYPELLVCPAGLYAHPDRPWQMASPDRLLCDPQWHDNPFPDLQDWPHPNENIVALLECKYLVQGWDGWGPDGSDEVPVHYRAQALWQADVLGVQEVHIAAWHGADLRVYVIRWDEADIAAMIAAGRAFRADVAAGVVPDIDEHTATLRTVKALHPDIEDRDQIIPDDIATQYRNARIVLAEVRAEADRWEAKLRDAMGSARRAVTADGTFIASRSIYDRAAHEVAASTVDRLNPARSPK